MKDALSIEEARERFTEYLEVNKCRKTMERFSILEFIYMHDGHYCVDYIFCMLQQKYRVSKATVYNTLEHLPTLVEGLIDNDVELCAITDHDEFNYEIYRKLKEEEKKDNCIKKVLPGIEFSVEFLEGKIIHIVTIFDDKDDAKVKNIEQIMSEGKGVTGYRKTNGAYPRGDYFDILNEINIDFIMIAHQKKTVTSQHKPHANDVMSLGKDTFNQLVFMDYFDAYEFRNKKNEIYNKYNNSNIFSHRYFYLYLLRVHILYIP